jgi:hypothetical protein
MFALSSSMTVRHQSNAPNAGLTLQIGAIERNAGLRGTIDGQFGVVEPDLAEPVASHGEFCHLPIEARMLEALV